MSGVHYDNPMRVTYNLGLHDYGAGGDALAIAVPAGVGRCRIEEISLSATETFTAVTTAALVQLGTTGDPNRYAELSAGTLADTDGLGLTDSGKFDIGHGGKGIVDFGQEATTQIEVTLVAPTGGTPAGIAHTNIGIAWW